MSYCTLDDLKTYLGITSRDTDDALLYSIITRAQQYIDTHCKRKFEASADTTKYLDAVEDVDGYVLYLGAAGDLCAITSVTNGDDTVLAATDYVTQPRSYTPYHALRLLASSGYTWTYDDDHENAITIVGKWAYSTSAPNDIVQACVRLAAWFYHQKDNSADLDRPVIAGNSTILPARMPTDVMELLAPYRRLV